VTEPTPRFEPLTPVEVERQIRWVQNKLTQAQAELRDARDAEVSAKHTYERAYRKTILSGDCPKVTRGGYTTAERDAWVADQCADEHEAYELAEVKRKAAEEHLRTLYQQGTLSATLAKSVGQAYQMAGVGER
jgi:hypothetical protein